MIISSERWKEMSDEEIGKLYFKQLIELQAEKQGISSDSITSEFIDEVKSMNFACDETNLEEVAIKEALLYFAKNEWAKGGSLLKIVLNKGAHDQAAFNIAKKYVPFLPGKRKGAIKETTRYLKDLRAAYPNESAKNLYKIVLNESMEGNTPFQYDHIDGGLLYDGENEINMESFIKRLSKAKK